MHAARPGDFHVLRETLVAVARLSDLVCNVKMRQGGRIAPVRGRPLTRVMGH